VPGFEHYHATRVLDGGALGIVIPHVDDAETAARMVSNCRYPPDGQRSMAGGLPQLGFERHSVADTAKAINDATLVVVMIETETAVANADAIAAVPGVDSLLIGTNDLCLDMGIPGQYDDARVKDAYAKVIAACKAHGKYAGMGGVYDPALMTTYIDMGMRLIIAGSDFSLMLAAARTQAATVRELL
jgi:2-keto-3-deoxy-L-rhamnonate aldolase RhmA